MLVRSFPLKLEQALAGMPANADQESQRPKITSPTPDTKIPAPEDDPSTNTKAQAQLDDRQGAEAKEKQAQEAQKLAADRANKMSQSSPDQWGPLYDRYVELTKEAEKAKDKAHLSNDAKDNEVALRKTQEAEDAQKVYERARWPNKKFSDVAGTSISVGGP